MGEKVKEKQHKGGGGGGTRKRSGRRATGERGLTLLMRECLDFILPRLCSPRRLSRLCSQ